MLPRKIRKKLVYCVQIMFFVYPAKDVQLSRLMILALMMLVPASITMPLISGINSHPFYNCILQKISVHSGGQKCFLREEDGFAGTASRSIIVDLDAFHLARKQQTVQRLL